MIGEGIGRYGVDRAGEGFRFEAVDDGAHEVFQRNPTDVLLPTADHAAGAHAKGGEHHLERSAAGIDDQIAEGDKVVTRLTAIGKHDGDLPGAPRTGNDLMTTAIVIHRIADGKLVEKWSEKDLLGFLPQIGSQPAPHDETG